MSGAAARITTLTRVAWACAALVLAITSLSAFIRLSRAGLGCEPWPQCYTRSTQVQAADPAGSLVTAARVTHRVVAVIALLFVIALVMTTLATGPMLWREGRMALGLLGLALFLAVLGRWTADARVPAVMLGNLLGGFAMFALSCVLALQAGRQPAPPDRLMRWSWFALALLTVQIVSGGLVSAGHAGLSCPQLFSCDLGSGSWRLLNPWNAVTLDARDPTHAAGALVHGLHRLGAMTVAAVLLSLGVAAWRTGRRAGAILVMLVIAQFGLGLALVAAGLPLAVALAHNVGAALLVATVSSLATGGAAAPRAGAAGFR
jgi:heme a synthase